MAPDLVVADVIPLKCCEVWIMSEIILLVM